MISPQPVKDTAQEKNNQDFYRDLKYLQGEIIEVKTTVGANTDFSVSHSLGRIPQNVEVLVKQGQSAAYLAVRPGATAWSNTAISLQCNTASAVIRLRLT